MTTKTLVPVEKKLVTLEEDFFYVCDPEAEESIAQGDPSWTLDLKDNSWVWVFTGRRGSGKTTSMTFEACRAMALLNMRVLSNYPIEFVFARSDGKCYPLKAEALDLYKLMSFDQDYKHCLICLDEAPDIISHLASQTWKNRLLNIFVRQLRKNGNSLFMAAQDFQLIDKSMRWQTDVVVECNDAASLYGRNDYRKGTLILLNFLDNSGLWTGETYEDVIARNKLFKNFDTEVGCKYQLFPERMWGDETHKAVYDTYYQQDVWESLRKVDLHLSAYKVGDDEEVETGVITRALPVVEECIETLKSVGSQAAGIFTTQFYARLGALTAKEKDVLSKRLAICNVSVGCDTRGKRYYDFRNFDLEAFKKGVVDTP